MNITTYNEFCFIIWYYTPLAYDAYLKGNLTSTNSKIGTEALFYFSKNHTESEQHNWTMLGMQNHSNQPFYNHTNEFLQSLDNWTPPPYKEHFKNDIFVYDKPIITIHNKSTIEWERGLFNSFDIPSLRNIFSTFKDSHQIVYIRPPLGANKTYQHDQGVNTINIGDTELIHNEFPEVIMIEDLQKEYNYSYNELQMMLSSNSDRHIAVAGGEASIASYFGGDVLIYRHPSAPSCNRGVWFTDSYLKLYSNANIYGLNDYNELLNKAVELWK